MKNRGSTLFKITGILAIVTGALLCVNFWAIFPIILGGPLIWGGVEFLKYTDMTDEEILAKESTLIVWIVVFFIGSVYLGVLALIALFQVKEALPKSNGKTTEVNGNINPEEKQTEVKPEPKKEKDKGEVLLEKLQKINKLKEDGLISEEEYNKLKEDIINK